MLRLTGSARRRTLLLGGASALVIALLAFPRVRILDLQNGAGRGDATRIWDKWSVGQTITPTRNRLTAVAIAVAPEGSTDEHLEFSIRRNGQTLLTLRGPMKKFLSPSGDELFFRFPPLKGQVGAELRISLEAPGTPAERALPVRFELSSHLYPDGERFENDVPRPGDLGFTTWVVGGFTESWQQRILQGNAGQWFAGITTATLFSFLFAELVRRRRAHRVSIGRVSILLWCITAALIVTLPIYARMGLWAVDEGDWPEVVAHLSATRQTLAQRELPGWNPYICGGSPNLANPQPFFLSAALPLSFLVGEVVATKFALTIGLAVGLTGMAFLARALGLRGPAAILTTLVFPLSGFMTSHLTNGQFLWLTVDYLPWIVFGFIRALRSSRWWLLLTGALTALTFIEGRVYLVAYLGALLVVLGIGYAVAGRSWRPLVSVALALLLTLGLAAWKIFPTLWFLHDRVQALPDTSGIPLAALDDAFLERNVTPNVDVAFGQRSLPRHEYAAYVGILPVLLAVLGIFNRSFRSHGAIFAIAGGVFLGLAMQPADTSLFEYLPITRELRNPSRMIILVVLSLAVLAGAGLQRVAESAARGAMRFRAAAVVPWIILAVIGGDLLTLNTKFFARLFSAPAAQESFDRPAFFQTRLPERQPTNGYPTVAAGKGAKDFCPPVLRAYRPENPVRAREDARYRGEVFALGRATATVRRFTPNMLAIAVAAPEPDTIVVNQKHDRGWSASPLVVQNHEGLLAVAVPAGEQTVHLRYRTPGLALGAAVTLATIVALAVIRWRRKPQTAHTTCEPFPEAVKLPVR